MILLVLSFWGSFRWYPIENFVDLNLYELILNSVEGSALIRQYGGEENIEKGFIHLDGSIFKGGVTVLLPKGYKIKRLPENLKFLKRPILMKRCNRYSAIYKDGQIKEEWEELKIESEEILGVESIDNIPLKKLKEFFPERIPSISKNIEGEIEEELDEGLESMEAEEKIIYPEKFYFSFILVEEDWREKLIPVILNLSPIDETIEKYKRIEKE